VTNLALTGWGCYTPAPRSPLGKSAPGVNDKRVVLSVLCFDLFVNDFILTRARNK
jgi:hypothetical protein